MTVICYVPHPFRVVSSDANRQVSSRRNHITRNETAMKGKVSGSKGVGVRAVKNLNAKGECNRCGRTGHWIKDCYAGWHVNGTKLEMKKE
jgi:hypothetical protein